MKDEEIDGYKEKVKALLNQIKDKNNILNRKNNTILKLNDEMELKNINNSNTEIIYLKNQLQSTYDEMQKIKLDNKIIINNLNKQILIFKNEKQKLIQTINSTKEECKQKDNRIRSLMKVFTRQKQNNSIEDNEKPSSNSNSNLKQNNYNTEFKNFNYKDPLENLTSKFNFSFLKNKVANSLDDEILRKLTNNKNLNNYDDDVDDNEIIHNDDKYNDLLKKYEESRKEIKTMQESNDKLLIQKIREINQLNSLVNDLKIKNEIDLNKLKKEIEDLNNKNSKLTADLKNTTSNNDSENNNNNNNNENLIKELNIYKNSAQELEESLRDVKIESVVKTRQIEEY